VACSKVKITLHYHYNLKLKVTNTPGMYLTSHTYFLANMKLRMLKTFKIRMEYPRRNEMKILKDSFTVVYVLFRFVSLNSLYGT
jgi:hypothetical protein